ncbi:Small heat shock protein HSP [Trema orientale]|uniref:Small heat shock protein HSP n=1 Tax=Trema orientale TaxID=63057 RepID=A0A2P5E5X2_TREOI|nr:Small heat shock protein HSP [Trema orientale]
MPSFFRARRNVGPLDPFALDVWDPFKTYRLLSRPSFPTIPGRSAENDTWHRVERGGGKFVRRFRLPENAKMDQVKVAMENGVLTVTVPKAEVEKPDVQTIEISG